MNFKNFNNKINAQFAQMCKTGKLFRTDISGDKIWETYLLSFEKDEIFRDPKSSSHNCNCCKNFIRRYGNVVAISENGSLISMFSNLGDCNEYTIPAKNIAKLIVSAKIVNVFFETYNELNCNVNYEKCSKSQKSFKLGIEENHKIYNEAEVAKFGKVKLGEVYTFNHFCIDLPKEFVDFSGNSIEAIMATYRDKYNVFKRAMEEISLDTLILVKDLINQGSLLDGTAHLHAVEEFIKIKNSYFYDSLWNKDIWSWYVTYSMDERIAKFKNTLIGVLCTELSEGMELNKACENWNKRVDPINYHKATAPITERQKQEARKFVEENGYEESFNRRFATIDDIKVSEIKHINSGNDSIKKVSVFDNVKTTSTQHKRSEFDKVEEISIEKFMKDILPNCTYVESFLENRMSGNLVTMTTSANENSKPMFKWSNNYSWTFNGNLAGKSMIKDAVQSRGGKTEGFLNIRLHFPNTTSDYDLHAKSFFDHIYYGNRRTMQPSSGMLDLDAQGADGHFPPEKRVENIIYTDPNKFPMGSTEIFVHNYSNNDNNYGFTIEIELNGEITTFTYNKFIPDSDSIKVCQIVKSKTGFEVVPILPVSQSNSISKEIWNLETNKFHKVNLMCLSPNHWDNNKVGNLHYFFMLDKCKVDTSIRSFHNENLTEDLLKHRKVMEVLGASTMIEPTDKQLSGLGFNSTVRDELIVKVQGSFKRMLKIKF